ncbi:MAG: transglutaminase domain-containing protein [Methanoregula sp.]|jgi:transglutaminase-like putative cysteine protease|nr:transglutaminase domain-containing protein [Methanoregula sp.]
MKPVSLIAILLIFAAVLAAGCTSPQTTSPASQGDTLYAQAEGQFAQDNYHAAAGLYGEAYDQYTAEGNAKAAHDAYNKASISVRMTAEFPYNRSEIVTLIDETFPDVSAERKASWLPCDQSQCIMSDGETWYFANTINNIRSHNLDLTRKATAAKGETPFYDQTKAIAFAPPVEGAGNYQNPVTWEGTETLSIPAGELPKTGTLRLWIPLPVETESQRDVTIISVEPAQYVKSQTGTGADMGLVYLEVPLGQVTGDFLTITARFGYTRYEQRFTIDPAKVMSYDTNDPEYLKYTSSGKNIVITPEMKAKALEIVGTETNPYLQAEKLYWHVISHYYSNVPHARLSAGGTPESVYMLESGFGDCGTQSMYFAALCRSLGIPARAVGGYQLVPTHEGTHFWSEYYLPGYGWIPNDVTIAEGAEWSYDATDDERHQYKAFYASNLDPYRYVIQKDVDVPLTPDPGDVVMFDMVVQSPKAVCDTCTEDPELGLLSDWKITVKKA